MLSTKGIRTIVRNFDPNLKVISSWTDGYTSMVSKSDDRRRVAFWYGGSEMLASKCAKLLNEVSNQNYEGLSPDELVAHTGSGGLQTFSVDQLLTGLNNSSPGKWTLRPQRELADEQFVECNQNF